MEKTRWQPEFTTIEHNNQLLEQFSETMNYHCSCFAQTACLRGASPCFATRVNDIRHYIEIKNKLEHYVMSDPIFKYCPMCATALIEKAIHHVLRPACPTCGFIQYFNPKLIVLVVIQYADKLLLSKRNIEPAKGLWNFCGGFVELGETLQEAAIREVKEESNLDVQLENLIGIYSGDGDSRVVIAYQASIFDHQISSLAVQQEESSELAFFTWEELPTLAFPVHQKILRDWKKLNSK